MVIYLSFNEFAEALLKRIDEARDFYNKKVAASAATGRERQDGGNACYFNTIHRGLSRIRGFVDAVRENPGTENPFATLAWRLSAFDIPNTYRGKDDDAIANLLWKRVLILEMVNRRTIHRHLK